MTDLNNIDNNNIDNNNKILPEKFAKFVRFGFFFSQQFNSQSLVDEFFFSSIDNQILTVKRFLDDYKNIKKNFRKLIHEHNKLNITKHIPHKNTLTKRKYNKKIVHNTGDSFIDNIINAAANTQHNIQQNIEPNIQQNIEHNIEQNIEPNIEQNIEPNIQQNIEPNIQQNIEPNIQQNIEPNIEPKTTKTTKTTKEPKAPKAPKTPKAPKKNNIQTPINTTELYTENQIITQEYHDSDQLSQLSQLSEQELEVLPFEHNGQKSLIDQLGNLYHINSHLHIGTFIDGIATFY